ncbi:hypothetical protein BDV95DRAFT_386195 [Massariosphaeria phaeospora]|uniref:Secreted protein n=1 Tax=Massariosphaeria phaeospora TaxID=100035 RepID=A0A7C8I7A7_9PLEO|nr:hypothetical protein BDV95DRAFT_386195 [Massariosphaeria phaeospora]
MRNRSVGSRSRARRRLAVTVVLACLSATAAHRRWPGVSPQLLSSGRPTPRRRANFRRHAPSTAAEAAAWQQGAAPSPQMRVCVRRAVEGERACPVSCSLSVCVCVTVSGLSTDRLARRRGARGVRALGLGPLPSALARAGEQLSRCVCVGVVRRES